MILCHLQSAEVAKLKAKIILIITGLIIGMLYMFIAYNPNHDAEQTADPLRGVISMIQPRPERPDVRDVKIASNDPIEILQERLSAIQDHNDFHGQSERGLLALTLAKYFYALGENEKADTYFNAIPVLERRENAIQPFAVHLAYLIEQDDYNAAYAIITDSNIIHEKIMAIPEVHEVFDLKPHRRGTILEEGRMPYDQRAVNEALCKAAAQAIEQRNQEQRLEDLLNLPQCNDEPFTVSVLVTLRVASLLKSNEFAKANALWVQYINQFRKYDHDPDGWWKSTILGDYTKCFDEATHDADEMSKLDKAKDEVLKNFTDKKASLLTTIFLHTEQYESALELVSKFQDEDLKRKLIQPIYAHFVEEGDEKQVKKIANIINLEKAELNYIGGWGAKDKTQWHSSTSPEIKALTQGGSDIAYNQIMSIENDKMRFMGLLYLYDTLEDKEQTRIYAHTKCKTALPKCIESELERIAAVQDDDFDKDVMRKKIHLFHVKTEQLDKAINDLHMIIDPKRMVMTYDFGSALMSGLGLTFMNREDCEDYISKLPEYIRPQIVDGEQGKKIKNSNNLLACHLKTGKYKDFVTKLDDSFNVKTKERYLFNLSRSLMKQDRIDDALELLYMTNKSNDAKTVETTLFLGMATDSLFRDSPKDMKKAYSKRLEALAKHPAYAENKAVWAHILLELIDDANFHPELLSLLDAYYSKWPALEEKWKSDPLFYSKICAIKNIKTPDPFISTTNPDGSISVGMRENLPYGKQLLYDNSFTKIPDKQQEHVYNRCVRQWLLYEKMNRYDEAISFTKTMFPDPYYQAKAALAIIQETSEEAIPAYKIGDKYGSWRTSDGVCKNDQSL